MHEVHNIPSDGDGDMDNNELTPKWKRLKRWEDEEMLDSMQHLQKTNDRPTDEGQDDEQDAKDDEDIASDVDSSIPQSSRS